MTKDLEATLAELGEGYREVVERVCDAYRPAPSATLVGNLRRGRMLGWSAAYLGAASLTVALGFFMLRPVSSASAAVLSGKSVYTIAYRADAAATHELVATQGADGSWANDFLTCQNAAALRSSDEATARKAYRKALRYLNAKGLSPLSDDELRARSDRAAAALCRG